MNTAVLILRNGCFHVLVCAHKTLDDVIYNIKLSMLHTISTLAMRHTVCCVRFNCMEEEVCQEKATTVL